MIDTTVGQSPGLILESFRREKEIVLSDILGGRGLYDTLVARTAIRSFLDEPPHVMFNRAADLLSAPTLGLSRAELLAFEPRQYSTSEAYAIGSLAVRLGMSRLYVVPSGLIDVPNDEKTIIIEGGANRTSIYRRNHGLHAVNNNSPAQLFQLGSGRLIEQVYPDGSPDPEYEVALSIAPRLRSRQGDPISEYELNLATAFEQGWKIDETKTDAVYTKSCGRLEESYVLGRPGSADVVSIKPKPEAHGRASLRTGIAAVEATASMAGKHVAVATTSQYGPSVLLQTALELERLGTTDTKIYSLADTDCKRTRIYAMEIAVLLRQFAALD